MDLDGADNALAFLMGAEGSYTIQDAAGDVLRLDKDFWAKLVTPCGDGLDIIRSAGAVCREEQRPSAERVRFILRFVRSLYRFILIDMGRLSPFSASVAAGVSRLLLVSTCDMLGLHEAKAAVQALGNAGIKSDQLAIVLNQAPQSLGFTDRELEKILGAQVDLVLPDARKDFAHSAQDGKRLGESRAFQQEVARFAARIVDPAKEAPQPKTRFPFLRGVLRGATTTT